MAVREQALARAASITGRHRAVVALLEAALGRPPQDVERFLLALHTELTGPARPWDRHREQALFHTALGTSPDPVAAVADPPPVPAAPAGPALPHIKGLGDITVRVLLCVADGLSNIEIAERTGLSAGTVSAHLKVLYRYYGTRGRRSLIGKARARMSGGVGGAGHS